VRSGLWANRVLIPCAVLLLAYIAGAVFPCILGVCFRGQSCVSVSTLWGVFCIPHTRHGRSFLYYIYNPIDMNFSHKGSGWARVTKCVGRISIYTFDAMVVLTYCVVCIERFSLFCPGVNVLQFFSTKGYVEHSPVEFMIVAESIWFGFPKVDELWEYCAWIDAASCALIFL